jgi:hypothetical protein
MPPAEEESHPPQTVSNDAAEAEELESDDYEIEVCGHG